MFSLPPVPAWAGLHPLVVHFPIGLLLVVPVLVVLGMLFPSRAQAFGVSALVLLVIGTAFTFLAVATGEAAGELADRTPAVKAALERHEDLASDLRVVFSVLTVAFAAILFLPRVLTRSLTRGVSLALCAVFLVFYLGGCVLLANAAHQGGVLVHQLGVHSIVAGGPAVAGAAQPGVDQRSGERDEDDR